MLNTLNSLFIAAVLAGTPLLLGALGEILTEKSGNLNLGVEGMMFMGAITGLAGSYYYEQAVKAIELNGLLNLPENLYEYKNVALYDLINNVAQSRKVGFYCHPALLQLMEYDKQNGSQLYETLGCLARNGFNSAATATGMFLHRHTLSYRKQKIAAMTGIDLDDFNTQFMLKYSYMIEEYIGKQSGTKL